MKTIKNSLKNSISEENITNRGERFLVTGTYVLVILFITGFSFIMFQDRFTNTGKNETALYHKITASYELKEYQKALAECSDFNAQYPDSTNKVTVMVIEAEIFFTINDIDKTRDIIQKIFSENRIENSDYVRASVLLGKITKNDGIYDPVAMNYLENAYLKAEGLQKMEIAGFLGYQALFNRDYKTAIKYFNISTGEEGIIGRARVYIDQGNYQAAIQEYMNFFIDYPDGARYGRVRNAFIKQSLYFAGNLKKSGDFKRSIQYYLNIADMFPDDPSAYEALIKIADIYSINKNYQNAADFLDKACSIGCTNGIEEALYNKAVVYYQWGKKNESIKLFKELQQKYPSGSFSRKSGDWIELIKKDIENN